MRLIILVAIGGSIGSVCRYLMQLWGTRLFPNTFPVGTFAVNILGCFAVGLVYGLANKGSITIDTRIFLATGFCGGFTTFSAFAYENISLVKQGDIITFLIYTTLSVVFGLLSVVAGAYLTKAG